MACKRSLLELPFFFLSSGVHSAGETPKYVTVKNPKTLFYDYLPGSSISVRRTCELGVGTFEVFAPPWRADGTSWVFVNFRHKPDNCPFWQGFVDQDDLDLASTEFLNTEAVSAHERNFQLNADSGSGKGFAQRFIDFYSEKVNYEGIYQNVMSWYGEKREGCVAFASTALRFTGVPIPLTGLKENDSISIVTKPFANYLIEDLGWQRIGKLEDAKPGDIGVTISVGDNVGYPTHVYVFAGWKNKSELMAQVIDNQGFTHPRPLLRSPLAEFSDKDPTDFFIRPS